MQRGLQSSNEDCTTVPNKSNCQQKVKNKSGQKIVAHFIHKNNIHVFVQHNCLNSYLQIWPRKNTFVSNDPWQNFDLAVGPNFFFLFFFFFITENTKYEKKHTCG